MILFLMTQLMAAEPPQIKVHDLGDLMSVQGKIERPSLVVIGAEPSAEALLQQLQTQAWKDLELEALKTMDEPLAKSATTKGTAP